jgi:transcription elongation factor
MQFQFTVLMAALSLASLGCARYPGMFYTEHTHFGLQVKVNPRENKPVDVNMGYDRGTFAVVPRTTQGADTSSVISKTDLCVRFVESSVVRNVFASGNAAKQITADGERVKALFQVRDSGTQGTVQSDGRCE